MYNGVALLPACMYGKHNYVCICIVEAQANLANTLGRKFSMFVLYQIKNKDRNSILNNPIRCHSLPEYAGEVTFSLSGGTQMP